MKTIKSLIILLISFICISCNEKTSITDSVMLKESNLSLSYELDDETKFPMLTLYVYENNNGEEILTFQNERKNQILFYEMKSGKFLYKIEPEYEGNNGVGRFIGYYINNSDDIFLTSGPPIITQINQKAEVKNKYSYSQASDGTYLSNYSSITHNYTPIIMLDNKMYITSACNRLLERNPVSAVIDLDTKEVVALPFEYPVFEATKDKVADSNLLEGFLSRCYDGENFIYSFQFDENIYIASVDHKNIKKIPVKSRYIPKVKFPDLENGGNPMKNTCENPNYGNLYYDKYRKIYYRVAYPENELDNNENFFEIWNFGRKKFSIIILDKDFNIIGETLFPDFIYIPTLIFINEDGLYISNSHFKNPNFDENKLSFQCFQLIKNN